MPELRGAAGRVLPGKWGAMTPSRAGSLPAWMLATFTVALLLRVGFVVGQLQLHVLSVNFNAADSTLYRELAQSLLNGDGFAAGGHATAFVTPGYPLLLALLFEISHATIFIALVQCFVGSVTCVLLAHVGNRLGGNRAAWATGLIAAIYPHLIFWTGYVLTETLYVFALALSLVVLVHVIDRPSPARALVTGLLFGATVLVRPTILGLWILAIVAGLVIPRTRVATVLVVAGLVVALAPWMIRNEVVLHGFVMSTESGEVLYQGNSPGANGGSRGYVDSHDFTPLRFRPGTSEVEMNRIYQRDALRWMVNHPVKVLELAPKKLWNMWRPTYTDASTLDKLVTYGTYPALVLLGLAGLWLGRRIRPLGWLLIAFFAYHLFFHALVTGMIRFRLPIEAVLTISAGLALAQLSERRGWGRGGLAGLPAR